MEEAIRTTGISRNVFLEEEVEEQINYNTKKTMCKVFFSVNETRGIKHISTKGN